MNFYIPTPGDCIFVRSGNNIDVSFIFANHDKNVYINYNFLTSIKPNTTIITRSDYQIQLMTKGNRSCDISVFDQLGQIKFNKQGLGR